MHTQMHPNTVKNTVEFAQGWCDPFSALVFPSTTVTRVLTKPKYIFSGESLSDPSETHLAVRYWQSSRSGKIDS